MFRSLMTAEPTVRTRTMNMNILLTKIINSAFFYDGVDRIDNESNF
jgi:hypothetical protein